MKYLVLLWFFGIGMMNHAEEKSDLVPEDPAIARLREGLINSFKAGDMDRLVAYLEPNAVITWQSGEVFTGRKSIIEAYQKLIKGDAPLLQSVTIAPTITGQQLHGDWLLIWGNLNDQFKFKSGSGMAFQSRFTLTAHRVGDVWSVASLHLSANVFENPMLSMATKNVVAFSGVLAGLLGLAVGFTFGKSWGKR